MKSSREIIPPPPDAHVVVEGGYYAVRPYRWEPDALEGPRTFLLDAARDTSALPFEILRKAVATEAGRVWVVLEIPDGQTASLSNSLDLRRILTFEPPTASELHSLAVAMETGLRLQRNGNRVSWAFLFGDLSLPAELREPLAWAIPASYRELLAAMNATVVTESNCRNIAAKRIVRQAGRLLRSKEGLESRYAEAGFSLDEERSAVDSTLYLAADALLDCRVSMNPVIALTLDSRPSCASTVAGKLHHVLRSERTLVHYISWYDSSDDPDIRNKNVEGFVVAACFFGELVLDAQIVTLHEGRITHVDHLKTAEIRKPGVRPGYCDLLLDTQRAGRHHGIDLAVSSVAAGCCARHQFKATV